jgi:hypothetical protein
MGQHLAAIRTNATQKSGPLDYAPRCLRCCTDILEVEPWKFPLEQDHYSWAWQFVAKLPMADSGFRDAKAFGQRALRVLAYPSSRANRVHILHMRTVYLDPNHVNPWDTRFEYQVNTLDG